MRRKRTCSECGKPLGNTLGKCHEHGGDNYRAGGSMMYQWSERWKLWYFGVPYDKVQKAHEESKKRREEALKNSPRLQ